MKQFQMQPPPPPKTFLRRLLRGIGIAFARLGFYADHKLSRVGFHIYYWGDAEGKAELDRQATEAATAYIAELLGALKSHGSEDTFASAPRAKDFVQ